MNLTRVCDEPTASALAAAWLDAALRPVSEYGRRVYATIVPFAPGEEAAAQARARRIMQRARVLGPMGLGAAHDILRTVPDAVGAIAKASLGDALADPDLLEVLRFVDALARIDALMEHQRDGVRLAGGAVGEVGALLADGRAGSQGFYLNAAFDSELGDARDRVKNAQSAFDACAERELRRVREDLGRDDVTADEFVIMREPSDKPLPAGVRVLREAPTYRLCALQWDAETLAALQRRDEAAQAVALIEESVRQRLSQAVGQRAAQLQTAAHALGELDVEIAGARFAVEYHCVEPDIVTSPELSFEGARFLPLAAELARQGRSFVPLDLELHDTAVLTGPNMGGKTVCLRTCGFIALCAALGLPVPARRARTSLFDAIAWLGIGADEEPLGGLLSSFAKEIVGVRDMLSRGGRLLVLADEFARTTTPTEAKALLIALLERLRERDARGLAATHLAGVARAAGVAHFAVRGLRGIGELPQAADLPQALAVLGASMDYSVAQVGDETCAQADALALAALLGLDERLIAQAHRHLAAG